MKQQEQQALKVSTSVGGNFLAGFTRPVDAVNKAFGMFTNTDTAKDVRQGTGM